MKNISVRSKPQIVLTSNEEYRKRYYSCDAAYEELDKKNKNPQIKNAPENKQKTYIHHLQRNNNESRENYLQNINEAKQLFEKPINGRGADL